MNSQDGLVHYENQHLQAMNVRRLADEAWEAWRLQQGVEFIRITREEWQALVTWVRSLEARVQALEGKE